MFCFPDKKASFLFYGSLAGTRDLFWELSEQIDDGLSQIFDASDHIFLRGCLFQTPYQF